MIRLDYNPTFSQAAWQNAVPLVHSLQLSGSLAEPQLHLQLTLTCDPPFAAERSWNIPQLRPGQVLTIEDCEPVPSPAFFQDLNEACRGLLQLVLRDSAGRVLDQQSHPVRLLSRHEWGGCSDRLELLAAFVLPNDPAVPPLLRHTVQILQQQGLPALLDGYVRGSRDVVTQTVAALWSAVCARGIHYALPPAGFEDNGQKVRTVSEVLQQQLGTCLDLTLESRDAVRYEQQTGEHLERAVALDLLQQNELAASAEPAPLQLRLTELYRQARSDLAEGGSNTLFLALGFLRWRRTSQDSRQFLAPLLLLPVQLHRQHASAPFELVAHADDPQFNSTLVQLLKRDFQCDLSRVETQLPTDDSGLDVAGILQLVRQLVRPVRGLEVLEDVALATFSFARHLLWKDLVDRGDVLEENRLIHYLVRQPDQPYSSGGSGPLPTPEDVDRLSPGDLKAPLPADSSQLRAVATAAAGHDFVLIGPPGTGKSQTIANIIAQCLSQRRSVLFVAEKTAALEVVQRRLELAGLG
ncbi:MAG: DUF4011 domain-containing protein, partial [Planctomyces sp.]